MDIRKELDAWYDAMRYKRIVALGKHWFIIVRLCVEGDHEWL